MIDVLVAKTHTSDYLLHKYWARKPHNVLSELIKSLIKKENGVVLDPFCGSGVFLREASKLGHQCIGFDVNPVAAILSDVTCNPPDDKIFSDQVEPLLKKFEELCSALYLTLDGKAVRYYVHEIIIACPSCGLEQSKEIAKLKNGRSVCRDCETKLSFALSNLIETKITSIVCDDKTTSEQEEIANAKKLESTKKIDRKNRYNKSFPLNKRILSFEGMATKDLFTERNFYLLSSLANWLHKIEDRSIRNAALLLLTASVAQCSRLIAYRNNLTTGGPAWSVPGFWVPAQHLETNPYNHIAARYRKFVKGLASLYRQKTSSVKIFNDDCVNISSDLDAKVDLVFLDPPYGDSVPYMEFSMIWNSFLVDDVDVSRDISVSDRDQKKTESWLSYKQSLADRIIKIRRTMSKDGKLLITFNNHDYRAWEALIFALQTNHMVCVSTTYQVPAVISSKAQFSKDGSYISDIYSVYIEDNKSKPVNSLECVEHDLIRAAEIRDGTITKSVLYRAAFVSILKNNVAYDQLSKLEKLIERLFVVEGNLCSLKAGNISGEKVTTLSQISNEILATSLIDGHITWDDYFSAVASRTRDLGIPEPSEVMQHIEDKIVLEGGVVRLIGDERFEKQLAMFNES